MTSRVCAGLRINRRPRGWCGTLGGVGEQPDLQSAGAGQVAPRVGPLSPDQQPATKADLYAAVDALRADMRELLDQVRKLIQEADRRVSDAERADYRADLDDDEW